MNIGIFSGSFNPIHTGHIILANYIVEFTEIDEVWFLVSPQNPMKSEKSLLDERIRYEMTELALRKFDKLKASDFEFSLPKPSFTINTLEAISAQYPEHNFSLIIGSDNWAIFDKWKEHDKILQNYQLKVYPRLGSRITISNKQRHQVEALESPIVEISSSAIREWIRMGKDIRTFLPEGVYEYILEKGLYK